MEGHCAHSRRRGMQACAGVRGRRCHTLRPAEAPCAMTQQYTRHTMTRTRPSLAVEAMASEQGAAGTTSGVTEESWTLITPHVQSHPTHPGSYQPLVPHVCAVYFNRSHVTGAQRCGDGRRTEGGNEQPSQVDSEHPAAAGGGFTI